MANDGNGLKLAMNAASSAALREFADSLPIAVSSIVQATEELVQVYQSVADTVGVHDPDFREMMMLIKKAQEDAAEAISVLPPKLIRTAELIDEYIASKPSVNNG